MRTKAVVFLSVLAAVIWVRSSSGQVQPSPGPGSGIVNVRGIVDIGSNSVVQAVQRGDWKVTLTTPDVRVTNTPSVRVASYPFLRPGAKFEVQWPVGDREVITISQLGDAGWVRVDGPDNKRRWLNLALAKSIDEIP